MPAEVNKTNTNIEAYFDRYTGWMASSTEAVSTLLSSTKSATRLTSAFNKLIWASPLLAAQMAPITFVATCAFGVFTGLFSSITMGKVFENVDDILSGGKGNQNTNFKVSLIFALVIANKTLNIIPSLPTFYAAAAGIIFGIKASEYIPDKTAESIARFIDRRLPLPRCPGFEKPSSD